MYSYNVLVSDFEVPKSYAIIICSGWYGTVKYSKYSLLAGKTTSATSQKKQKTNNNNQQPTKPSTTTTTQQQPTTNNQQPTNNNKTTTSTNNNNNTLVTHSTLHCHWYINNKSPVSPAGKKSFFFVLADVGLGSGFTVQVLRGTTLATAPGPRTFSPHHSTRGVNAFNMPRVF